MIGLVGAVYPEGMKWLPGGWQRSDWADPGRTTVPRGSRGVRGGTSRLTTQRVESPEPRTRVDPAPQQQSSQVGLTSSARDVDVSAVAFRTLLIGGGTTGLLTVLCAATLVNKGSSVGMWVWQLVFGVLFLWFLNVSRGMLNGRGFVFDRSGFYPRTRGEVFAVPWNEITAVGVGSLPWVDQRRPVAPERRHALEFYPADPGFAERHPELERWRIEEPAPMRGLPGERYRFHFPPFSRLPKRFESVVQQFAPQQWVGAYRRKLPPLD